MLHDCSRNVLRCSAEPWLENTSVCKLYLLSDSRLQAGTLNRQCKKAEAVIGSNLTNRWTDTFPCQTTYMKLALLSGCRKEIQTFYSNIYPTRCNVTQFILSGNCSTCFGWYHHPSSGAQTTVSTTSGISHTVTATCRYSGR